MFPIEIFYSYAHQDELLRKELEKHLTIMKRQELITTWYSHEVTAGTEWKHEIDMHLNTAHIILPLLSSDFMSSDYCNESQMKRALERHKAKEACVIPVILRPVDWRYTPLGELQVLPKNGKPITSRSGRYGRDKAFFDVALGIRDVITALTNYWIMQQEQKSMQQEEKSSQQERNYPVSDPLKPGPGFNINNNLDRSIAELQAQRASFYFSRYAYEEALAIYEQALLLDPNNAATYIGMGETLEALHRQREALTAYEQALRLDSHNIFLSMKKRRLNRLLRKST